MRGRSTTIFLGLLLALLPAIPARSQATKAELSGVVRDAAGLPVSDALIELEAISTRLLLKSGTSPQGRYHFQALPPGSYRLTALKEGFAVLRRAGLELRVGDRLEADLVLLVGDISESVEVTAAPPLLQAARGTVSFNVEQRKVVTLPLDGRNFVPLLALSPGVNLPPGSTLPRVNGSRPRVSEYIYDGISVLQPEPGQVAYFPNIDAIEEFRVETNSYSAEYGRSNGGVIMVNHKAGTNQWRGTLFEFFRNEALNARNLFATEVARPRFRRHQYGLVAGGPIQKDRTFVFADWQATSLETGVVHTSTVPTSIERQGIFRVPLFDPATTRRLPHGVLRDPFPGGLLPASRIDPAAGAVAARYPAPNVLAAGGEGSANNYRRTGEETTAQDQVGARLDRYFGASHRLFGRYTRLRDDSRPLTALPDGSGRAASAVVGDTLTHASGIAAEHSWTLSPSRVNQLRFGYTRRGFERASLRTGRPASEVSGIPNLPSAAFGDVHPSFDIAGYQQLGPPASGNARFHTSVTQIIDNFSWLSGRQSLKLGTDLRIERLDVLQPPNPTGLFQFTPILTSGLSATGAPLAGSGNSFASFLLGQVQNYQADMQREILGPRARIAEFFFQDDVRATRRLTLNLGVRYTLNFPSTVAGDRGAVFNLDTQRLDFLGRDGFPRSARNLEKLNFGPRAGLAFRIADTVAARAGYGITWIEQAGITTPFTTPLFPFVRTVGQRSLDNLTPAFALLSGPGLVLEAPGPDSGLGQGVFGVQRDQKSGYAQQWNLSLQKAFGVHWSVEAGYLGSKLTNLGVPDVNLNQLPVEALALGGTLTEPVANPFYGSIPASSALGGPLIARQQLLRPFPRFTTVALYRNNVGHSTYHSLQSRLERRFSAGLTFSLAYTFSRLIDDAGAVFDAALLTGPPAAFQAADSFNRRLEKDHSTGSMPHVFSGSFVWELPAGRDRRWRLSGWRDALAGGWQLAGIVRAQSGSPVPVVQATNYNAFAGFGIQRPDRIADPALPAGERTTARWFDSRAFREAGPFSLGSSSRNPVTGPGYRTLDLMAGKQFPLTERVRLEFRAEAFNLTNTPPLANPNGTFGSPEFGSIVRALDPRVFEFVLKFHF